MLVEDERVQEKLNSTPQKVNLCQVSVMIYTAEEMV